MEIAYRCARRALLNNLPFEEVNKHAKQQARFAGPTRRNLIDMLDGLGLPWSLLAASARLVPLGLRDAVYNVIARNRLRWFGTRAQCYLPEPSQADRFLS